MSIATTHKQEKCIAAIIMFILLVWANITQLTTLFIIMGQAHFVATYYAQYRAGKITTAYLIRYAIAFIIFFGGYHLYPNSLMLEKFTVLWIAFHGVGDELYLVRSSPSFALTLTSLICVVLYVSIDWQCYSSGIIVVCAIAVGIAYFARKQRNVTITDAEKYLLLGMLVFLAFLLRRDDAIIGAFIIYHYASWYLTLFNRYRGDSRKLQHYLVNIISINAISLTLFLAYLWKPSDAYPLRYVFERDYFHLWALMHLFVTLRPQDTAHFRLWRAREWVEANRAEI